MKQNDTVYILGQPRQIEQNSMVIDIGHLATESRQRSSFRNELGLVHSPGSRP